MVFVGRSHFEPDGDDWVVYHTGPHRRRSRAKCARCGSRRWRSIPRRAGGRSPRTPASSASSGWRCYEDELAALSSALLASSSLLPSPRAAGTGRRAAGVLAVDERGLHDARRAALLPDLPPHRAARLPRLQGPRSVRVLRRPRRSASARHRRSERPAGTHLARAVRRLEARAAPAACVASRARRRATTTASPRRAVERPGRSRAARRAERQHLRAGAAAQRRSGRHVVARAAAEPSRHRSAARSARSQAARRLRRRSGQRSAARLHHRDRVGRRPGHEDLAGPDAVLRRQPIHRRAGGRLRHPRASFAKKTIAEGRTTADGLFEATLPDERMEDVVGVAQCGDQMAATDPGSWTLEQPARELAGYIYTDKPIYRPGHTVHLKAVLRWRQLDALAPFDRPDAEVVVSDAERQGRVPPAGEARCLRRGPGDLPGAGDRGARQLHDPHPERRRAGHRRLRGAGVSQAGVRSDRHAGVAIRACRAATPSSTVQARYYFGQPVANAQRALGRQPAAVLTRRCAGTTISKATTAATGTATTRPRKARCGSTQTARRRSAIPLGVDENGRDFSARIEAQVTDAASREVSGRTIVHATYGTFLLSAEAGNAIHRAGEQVQASIRAIDYLGTAQPNVPVALALEHLQYRRATTREPAVTPIATQTATTDADGRATGDVHAAQSHRQLPRSRHRAERRAHRAGRRVPLGAGPGRRRERHRRSLSRAARRQAATISPANRRR